MLASRSRTTWIPYAWWRFTLALCLAPLLGALAQQPKPLKIVLDGEDPAADSNALVNPQVFTLRWPPDVGRFLGIGTEKLKRDELVEIYNYLNEVAPVLFDPAREELPLPVSDGVPVYEGLLASASDNVKRFALRALSESYGAEAAAAVPSILELLADQNRKEQFTVFVARALGHIAPQAPTVVTALADRLARTEDEMPRLKAALIETLALAGAEAELARAELGRQLRSPKTSVQVAAYRALGALDHFEVPDHAKLRATRSFADLPPDKLFPILIAVRGYGPEASTTVPELLRLLSKEPPAHVKCLALEALGEAGRNDPGAARALLEAVAWAARDGGFVLELATKNLDQLDPKSSELVPVLAQALSHEHPQVRHQAAVVLKRFGPAGAHATHALATALKACDNRTDDKLVGAYLDALRSIGKDAREASDTVAALLPERSALYQGRTEYTTHKLRAYLLATLAEIGVPTSALPHILDSLANSNDRMVHLFAAGARAAAALGPQASQAVPFLLRPLKGQLRDEFINFDSYDSHFIGAGDFTTCRLDAIRALGRIGNAAEAAVPALQDVLTQKGVSLGGSTRLMRVPDIQAETRKALAAIQG
jgi:hypothetical protein